MSLSALGDQLYAVALTWFAVGVMDRERGISARCRRWLGFWPCSASGGGRIDGIRRRGMVAALTSPAPRSCSLVVAAWLSTGGGAERRAVDRQTIVVLAHQAGGVFLFGLQSCNDRVAERQLDRGRIRLSRACGSLCIATTIGSPKVGRFPMAWCGMSAYGCTNLLANVQILRRRRRLAGDGREARC